MREFVVACGNAPEILEPAIAAFDDVAAFVGSLVVTNPLFAVGPSRDHRHDTAFPQRVAKGIAVVSFVTQQLLEAGDALDAFRRHRNVRDVAGRENQHPRSTELIDDRMKLAVSPAPRDADRLFRGPPFPPPAQR